MRVDLKMIFLLSALLIGAAGPAIAGNVYLRAGAGGGSLDAWIELGDSNELSLGLISCKKRPNKYDLQVALSVRGDGKVSSDLQKLRDTEDDATQDLDFCMNGICEEHRFRAAASHVGDILYKNISIDQKRGKIRSVRVVVPNESMKYEYQGDVDGILKRICR